MIQRVQSIYLFLVVVLMSLVLFAPLVDFNVQQINGDTVNDEIIVKFNAWSVKQFDGEKSERLLSSWPIFFLVLVISLFNFFNIFLFSNRNLQMRFCVYNTILIFGLLAIITFYYFMIVGNIDGNGLTISDRAFRLALIFPVVSILLNILAFRAIRNDELLVRSYERLRK